MIMNTKVLQAGDEAALFVKVERDETGLALVVGDVRVPITPTVYRQIINVVSKFRPLVQGCKVCLDPKIWCDDKTYTFVGHNGEGRAWLIDENGEDRHYPVTELVVQEP